MAIPCEILLPVLSVSVHFTAQILGAASAAIWIYLLLGRGGFWRIDNSPLPRIEATDRSVAVIIPARNEEAVIGKAIASLLHQNYSVRLDVIVVDDHSTDRTAAVVKQTATDRVTMVQARPLPPGWTGKLWAIAEGLKWGKRLEPDYFLFTDADIVHSPDNIARLVARAEADNLDLVSLMVKLRCVSVAEHLLIPAFVYFFFQLYPPRWIASTRHRTAGAAGGCMLVRPSALRGIGGIAAIRSELIDDCALARRIKDGGGRIWLGTTSDTYSIREYGTFREIHRMIARTAFTQLRHSTALLIATLLAMAMVYLAPSVLAFAGSALGASSWALMTVTYAPMVRLYRQPFWCAALLPLTALLYIAATVHSAIRYWTGRGGAWKGRFQDSSL